MNTQIDGKLKLIYIFFSSFGQPLICSSCALFRAVCSELFFLSIISDSYIMVVAKLVKNMYIYIKSLPRPEAAMDGIISWFLKVIFQFLNVNLRHELVLGMLLHLTNCAFDQTASVCFHCYLVFVSGWCSISPKVQLISNFKIEFILNLKQFNTSNLFPKSDYDI